MKPKHKSSTTRKPKCINPDCPTKGTEYTRGLCEPCYRTLRRLIEVKHVIADWEEAESRALCRKRKPSGFKRFPIEASRKQPQTAKVAK